MTRLPDDRARDLADTVDAYDQQLADAQEGKRETFQTVRVELENLGLDKAAVKAELDGLKRAIRIRQLRRSKPEKLDQAEASEALALEYLDRIETARAPRATPARTRTREDRSKARTSEAMADHKEFSAELAEAGLISAEAHAENVTLADAVATKLGAGVVTIEPTKEPPPPAPRTRLIQDGHTWRNLRDAYGWAEDEIQERWLRGDEPGPLPAAPPAAPSQERAA